MEKKELSKTIIAGKALNALSKLSPKKAGKSAFELFCTPRQGKSLSPKEIKFLDGAKQIDISVQNILVKTYHWQGDGKLILLLHGYESNSARWRALVPFLLRHNYAVMAMDAPAHGLSGNKTLNGLLYAHCIEKAVQEFSPHIVIGHSLGGMSSGFYFSTFNYQPIERLIMMATPSRLRLVIDLFYRELQLNPVVIKEMESYFIEYIGFDIEHFTVGDYIRNCTIPGIIIHDEKDTVAPLEEAQHIHQNWNRSKLITTSGLGHFLQSGSVFKHIVEELK